MRAAQFILSAIIAAAIVYLIYQDDFAGPEFLSSSSNGFTVEFSTIPTAIKDSLVKISVKIVGPKTEQIKYHFRYAKPDMRGSTQLHRYGTNPLTIVDSTAGLYEAIIRTGVKGTVSQYYFEVLDPIGRHLAGLKLTGENPFTTLAIGQVGHWIFYGHYLGMFIAILAIAVGATEALKLLSGQEHSNSALTPFLVGGIMVLVSEHIFGTLVRMQMTGEVWQGAPLGTDLSDNLKQILVLYLIFLYLVSRQVGTESGQLTTISPRAVL
ncbi:MAG: hypothetical protein ACREBV_00495, partial [Candidatus Zixiibacteriota bacterium]